MDDGTGRAFVSCARVCRKSFCAREEGDTEEDVFVSLDGMGLLFVGTGRAED